MTQFRDRPTSSKIFVVIARIGALAVVFAATNAALSFFAFPENDPMQAPVPAMSPPASSPPAASATTRPTPVGNSDAQFKYRKRAAAAKKSLMTGAASIATLKNAASRDTFTVDLWVCAATVSVCVVPKSPRVSSYAQPISGNLASPAAAVQRSSLGAVKVGGRIRAALHGYPGVATTLMTDEVQPVTAKGDVAHWWWSIKVLTPGRYDLSVNMAVLKGDTSNSLTSCDFRVAIGVDDNAIAWIGRTGGKLVGYLSTATSAVSALITAMVGFWAYRHGKKSASTATPAIAVVPAPWSDFDPPVPYAQTGRGRAIAPPRPRAPYQQWSDDSPRRRRVR